MITPSVYDLMKLFIISSIFLYLHVNTIQKLLHLKCFHSKSFYWCLTFKCFLSISNTLHFRNCCTFHAFIFKLLSFEHLFHLKSFYCFLAFKRFLHISNLLHFRESFTLHVFMLRSRLLTFHAVFTCLYNWTLFMQFSFHAHLLDHAFRSLIEKSK